MISDAERSAEILKRFKNNDPLNLSVVQEECPHLLEGLFNQENFKGWRESIEQAGVPIGKIRIEPMAGVTCRECGFEGAILWAHLIHAHGMNSADYRDAHPGAETSSEARRAQMMSNRHGSKAKAIIPHWEPAWSRNYALDRIHEFSKQGIPLNYLYVSQNEPGFPAYVRRIFPSWDAGLEAAGLEPLKIRQSKESIPFNADQIIEKIRQIELEKPSKLHIRAARSGLAKTLVVAAFRNFRCYEKALKKAGIDPKTKIPALKDSKRRKARELLISETMERVKDAPAYDPADAKAFLDKHSATVRSFYGSWTNFATSLNLLERDIFNSPNYRSYDSQKKCIAGFKERAKLELSVRQEDVRTDNPSLGIMAEKHFGKYAKALQAADVQRLPHSYDQRTYANGDEVIAAIKLRIKKGQGLFYSILERPDGDRQLLKWSKRFFGSYAKALVAAGVTDLGVKPRSDKGISKPKRH